MGPFARRRGGLELRLGDAEAEILARVFRELRDQVAMNDPPAHLKRLFPVAYPDDTEAQSEFASYTHDDLTAAKLAALETLDRALGRGRVRRGLWSTTLDDEETGALLGALNDARLALGTRLDVTEEAEEEPIDESSPDAPAAAVYQWLGWLESLLVDQLLA
ncbi:MAG TPA: DUF2017 family protein [Actinomycetota bacterium]